MKGDPNDLIDVAITVGQVAQVTNWCPLVEFVYPHRWKGSVDKPIMIERILSRLTYKERDLIDKCGVKRSKIHNVIDGVGIGLWSLGRLGKAK